MSDSEEEDDDNDDEDPIYHTPCPTCDPNNHLGYICPIPVPTAPGQQIPQDSAIQGHAYCGFCGSIIPTRGIADEKCASCSTYSCHTIDEHQMCPESELTKFGGNTPPFCSFSIDY